MFFSFAELDRGGESNIWLHLERADTCVFEENSRSKTISDIPEQRGRQ